MDFHATYFGSSTWLIEFRAFRILIDPWLKGDLFFSPPGPWLINGQLNREFDPPKKLDLLLLTQGLADHSHIPSLEILDRSIVSVGSPSASKVLKQLNFQNVISLKPDENIKLGKLSIEATAGANVPGLENGYIVSNNEYSFYIEPHGFLDKKISARNLDVVISPVVNLQLPLVGAFIKGKTILPKLIELFNPKIVLASTTGGEANFTGILNSLISVDGSIDEASQFIEGKASFINPLVGKCYELKKHIK